MRTVGPPDERAALHGAMRSAEAEAWRHYIGIEIDYSPEQLEHLRFLLA